MELSHHMLTLARSHVVSGSCETNRHVFDTLFCSIRPDDGAFLVTPTTDNPIERG